MPVIINHTVADSIEPAAIRIRYKSNDIRNRYYCNQKFIGVNKSQVVLRAAPFGMTVAAAVR
jgi:hypothetical protein